MLVQIQIYILQMPRSYQWFRSTYFKCQDLIHDDPQRIVPHLIKVLNIQEPNRGINYMVSIYIEEFSPKVNGKAALKEFSYQWCLPWFIKFLEFIFSKGKWLGYHFFVKSIKSDGTSEGSHESLGFLEICNGEASPCTGVVYAGTVVGWFFDGKPATPFHKQLGCVPDDDPFLSVLLARPTGKPQPLGILPGTWITGLSSLCIT